MTKVGAILGWILVIQLVYSLVAALYVYFRVRGRTHKRYDGHHVYATIGQSEYHVPREVLELFMHIKDSRIQEVHSSKPNNPRVFFFAWGLALLLPRVVGRVVKPFDDAA